MLRLRSLLFFVFILPLAAFAQSVRWEPASGTLPRDQTSSLALVFDDCEPSENPPPLPSVPGLVFDNPSRSQNSSFNLTLGSRPVSSSTITYNYPVRATQPDIEVPNLAVDMDSWARSACYP